MVTFQVPNMTCGHCASTIAKSIADVDKLARIEVSVPGKLVSISSTAAVAELLAAIQDAGYTPMQVEASPVPAASSCCCASRTHTPADCRQRAATDDGSCCGSH